MEWTDRGFYIAGGWGGANGITPVKNPFDDSTLAHVSMGGTAEADLAVAAASAAFSAWSATSLQDRLALIEKVRQLLEAEAAEMAKTIALEVGTPIRISEMVQVGLPLQNIAATLAAAAAFPFEREIGNSRVYMEAVGVVAAITPWNYPLHQIVAKVVPAIIAGCTVILKPADPAPLNALRLADIFHRAGAPAGVLNVVTGPGRIIGEHLTTHPDVDMVSFTGSTGVGSRLGALGAAQIKRLSLELGGKSAAVLLADGDLQKAVKATVNACFLNSGQTCSALTRLIVPEARVDEAASIAAAMLAKFKLGDPMDPATRQGPLISAAQQDSVRQMIRAAEAEGQLVCGGADAPDDQPTGWFVKPTVFAHVAPDATIAQDEVFGPVLAVLGAADDDDAVNIANNSRFGLSGAIWAGTQERAVAAARRIRTGQIDINGGRFNPAAPFGGFKQSGHGREMGMFGLEEFLEPKSLQL